MKLKVHGNIIYFPSVTQFICIYQEELKDNISLSQLERYFARPLDTSFDNILLTEYYSFYIISNSLITYQFLDNGEIQYKVKKRNPNKIANYGIHPYSPTQHELFCLRLLLINFPARSFDDLLQFNELSFSTFADAACARGLIDNEKEFFDCMDEAIQSYRPSKYLRWLFCNLIRSGADCSVLYNKYFEKLNEDIKDEYALK